MSVLKYATLFLRLMVLILETTEAGVTGLRYRKMLCQYDTRDQYQAGDTQAYLNQIPVNHCSDVLIGLFNISLQRRYYHSSVQTFHHANSVKIRHLKARRTGLRVHLSVALPKPGKVFTPNQESAIDELAGKFAHQTMLFMDRHGYEGLNIYWNSAYSDQETTNLIVLLKALSEEPSKDYAHRNFKFSVTFEGFPLLGRLPQSVKDLHTYADFIIVKAFDAKTDSQPLKTSTVPLRMNPHDRNNASRNYFAQRKTLLWWVDQGTPAYKIIVAFPTYARMLISSPMAPAEARYPHSNYLAPIIHPHGAICLAHGSVPGWKYRYRWWWTSGYMHRNDRRDLMYGIGELSIKNKCDRIFKEGFRGLLAWTIFMDDYFNDCKRGHFLLIKTAYKCLQRHDEAY